MKKNEEKKEKKKAYHRPELHRFGKVEQITLNASQKSTDRLAKRGLAYM